MPRTRSMLRRVRGSPLLSLPTELREIVLLHTIEAILPVPNASNEAKDLFGRSLWTLRSVSHEFSHSCFRGPLRSTIKTLEALLEKVKQAHDGLQTSARLWLHKTRILEMQEQNDLWGLRKCLMQLDSIVISLKELRGLDRHLELCTIICRATVLHTLLNASAGKKRKREASDVGG